MPTPGTCARAPGSELCHQGGTAASIEEWSVGAYSERDVMMQRQRPPKAKAHPHTKGRRAHTTRRRLEVCGVGLCDERAAAARSKH